MGEILWTFATLHRRQQCVTLELARLAGTLERAALELERAEADGQFMPSMRTRCATVGAALLGAPGREGASFSRRPAPPTPSASSVCWPPRIRREGLKTTPAHWRSGNRHEKNGQNLTSPELPSLPRKPATERHFQELARWAREER